MGNDGKTADNKAGIDATGGPGGVSSTAVAERLEKLINAGEIVGGDRINESGLAQELGVGRAAVREACRALEQAGLVRSVPNRGFFVQEIGLKDALDIYEVRAALFRTAGRLLVEKITATQVADLRSAVDQMDVAAEESDFHRFYQLNEIFHDLVVEQCGNLTVQDLWPRLQTRLNLFRRRSLVVRGALKDANDEHRSIVDALERGDATAAALNSERHVLSGKARLLETISESPLGTRHGREPANISPVRIETTNETGDQ